MLLRQTILLLSLITNGAAGVATEPASTEPVRVDPGQDSRDKISLAGTWQVALGPPAPPRLPGRSDTSVIDDALRWEHFDSTQMQSVTLPGALRDSDLGKVVGPDTRWIGTNRPDAYQESRYAPYRNPNNFKMPFWWQPKRHFVGAAWYQRGIVVPARWKGNRVRLKLERPHWRTRVWIDGELCGANDSLSTAHIYDITQLAKPGPHTLTIGVDNGIGYIDVGENAHSVSDHTQTAWHGIIGEISLSCVPKIAIDDIQVHPKPQKPSLDLRIQLANATDTTANRLLRLTATQNEKLIGTADLRIQIPPNGQTIESTMQLNSKPLPWNEFHPNLCQLKATLAVPPIDELPTGPANPESSVDSSPKIAHSFEQVFGVRAMGTEGGRITIDGHPIFLRGTLECCVFPLTGYPPTDVESWKQIVHICKAHGFNHIRFHSWCPPEAAFTAADELGFYFQVECSSWPNQSTQLSMGNRVDEWLYHEGQQIVAAYANHPSFILLSAGNEPSGPRRGAEVLGPWVTSFKADGRHLVTGASGWPMMPQNDFHVVAETRIHQWGEELLSHVNSRHAETITNYSEYVADIEQPIVGHEIGQWCAFPNFEEIEKYTGSIRPTNFEVFRELLSEAGMQDQAREFVMASGKLQVLTYKEEIESGLRTPGYAGFQMLDLRDFPGQGTALVGILDMFWQQKPYIDAKAFRRFNGPIVPLAQMEKRVWTHDETFQAALAVSQFGPDDLTDVVVKWNLADTSGEVIGRGTLPTPALNNGGLRHIGEIAADLDQVRVPAKLHLAVSVHSPSLSPNTDVENDWEIWVYPPQLEKSAPDSGLLTGDRLTGTTIEHLHRGGRALLLPNTESIDTDVRTGMSPIFWNTVWTNHQAPHTLGVLCDPKHTLFENFPTDPHSNWQWWELLHQAGAMDLTQLPDTLEPIVQLVPDWFNPKRLSTLFECRVGNGKLLVCSMNLSDNLDQRPVARQLRHSIEQYVSSESFSPSVDVSPQQLRRVFFDPPFTPKNASVFSATQHAKNHIPARAIDGNTSTIWHTTWSPQPKKHPHQFTIDLEKTLLLDGVRYTPRHDRSNGRIANYQIKVSQDARSWTTVATGTFRNRPETQSVRFSNRERARYVQLVALSEVKGRDLTSLAEFDVILSDSKITNAVGHGSR